MPNRITTIALAALLALPLPAGAPGKGAAAERFEALFGTNVPRLDPVIVVRVDDKEFKRLPAAGDTWAAVKIPFRANRVVVEAWATGWWNEFLVFTYRIE